MSGEETRRSVLQKSAGAATLLAGSTAFTGTAAASSDHDYVVRIEGDTDGTYQFKIPYGSDDFWEFRDTQADEDDERATFDDQDREVICEGTVGSDGFDEWLTTDTGEPFATDENNCTVDVYKKVN